MKLADSKKIEQREKIETKNGKIKRIGAKILKKYRETSFF